MASKKRPPVQTVMTQDLQAFSNHPPMFDTGSKYQSGRLIFTSRDSGKGHNYMGNLNQSNTLDYNTYGFKNNMVDKFKK